MMSVPGLALFYGGLVRTKNMLSVLTQVFAIVSLVAIIWVVYGYSLASAAARSCNDYVGGFSKAFLKGVAPTRMCRPSRTGSSSPNSSTWPSR